MTRDEQKCISGFIEQTLKPAVATKPTPFDVEADAIIRALFVRNPEAAYRITLRAMAQAEELARVKTELAEIRKSFRGNWLLKLLKKQHLARNRRCDPRLGSSSFSEEKEPKRLLSI